LFRKKKPALTSSIYSGWAAPAENMLSCLKMEEKIVDVGVSVDVG
jgi:hypothetical protein